MINVPTLKRVPPKMNVNLGSKMKFFSKKEASWILVILLLIFSASLYNFKLSLRRARDAQRKADLGAITNALNNYQDDFGFYPPSSDGKIVACQRPSVEKPAETDKIDLLQIYRSCEWGKDSFRDVFDPGYPPYLKVLPVDPHKTQDVSYLYLSNGSHFQLYVSLEGEDETQAGIRARNLFCGVKICNFGKASGVMPLDKSIEEYENELLQKNEK